MKKEPVQIEIVEKNSDFLKVKLPFLDIPVEMNWAFFNKRLEAGYFIIKNRQHTLHNS